VEQVAADDMMKGKMRGRVKCVFKRKEREENSSRYIRWKEERKNYPDEKRFGKKGKNGKRKMTMKDK
jgi:hypothetical protein